MQDSHEGQFAGQLAERFAGRLAGRFSSLAGSKIVTRKINT